MKAELHVKESIGLSDSLSVRNALEAELFKQNPWWEKPFTEDSLPRENYLGEIEKGLKQKEITFLVGMRRIGKTTILKQTIGRLLAKGVAQKDVFFVNLDSFSLLDKSIHELVEQYRQIHKKAANDFFYLVLDEVVSRTGFEKELKSLYDNDNVKIVCASSLATAMRDKKALLTGRTQTIEINPLTFQEFLAFKNAEIGKADRAKREGYFKDYLRIGGVPHYVLTEDKAYLNELVESILYKDVIAYHNITNEKPVKELFALLCRRVGKPTSYNKLARILGVSVDTVKRFVSYFEKAYLFHVVDRHAKSLNEKTTSPKKMYANDVGVKNLVSGEKDFGASFENLVFLKIKHENPEYYVENGVEIDFVTKNAAIEAKYGQELTEKQRKALSQLKKSGREAVIAQGVDYFRS